MSLALIVMLPFIGALFPALLLRAGRNACATATFTFSLAAFVLLIFQAPAVLQGDTLHASWQWLPKLGLAVSFMLDGLGLLFAGLILGIGLLVIFYARFYLSKQDNMGSFYTYLLLFQGAMLGIVLSDNILLILVFWELTSLSSFLLIGYWKHLPAGRQGARMALTVTGAGGLSLIAGLMLLGHIVGSYDLSVMLQHRELIQSSPLYLPALLLILGGCFTKSAQFPFHFWLPHAMAAPTPVSAYLHSATMVKAGIFLLARLWPVLSGTPEWFYLVATTGLITMLVAAWIALFKDDLKGLLAFSTVSHLGLITLLLGLGSPMAAVAAVFHIINHATFKAALFMNAGIVDHETGTRDIKQLGGLWHLMPITATLAMVAAASMAGVPLLNGFLSKEMMLEQVAQTAWLDQPWLMAIIATLAALCSVAYSFRYIVHVFFGPQRHDYPHHPHDPPLGMWLPPAILVCLVILIGLFPQTFAGALVASSAKAVIGGALPDYHLAIWHGVTPALWMSVIALIGGLSLLASYRKVRSAWEAGPHPDAKAMFQVWIKGLVQLAQMASHGLHNGSLQRYLAWMVGAAVVVGYGAFMNSSLSAGSRELLPAHPTAIAAWLLLILGCLLTVWLHHQRLLALIMVGVIGMVVCVGFVYLSAPDLALTQISVEVVTVILMLLALNVLPKTTPKESGFGRKGRDILLATSAGVGIATLVWAFLTRDFTTLSDYYLAESLPGGGGTNVVNVILVDFRGFDTYGEITVLGIAALLIFALLDGALHGGSAAKRLAQWLPDQARAADRHPLMLVVAARVMLPLALLVGVFIFLRGHNVPGGGFIAGLVVSVALIMQYMASGFGWAAQKIRLDYHAMIGSGVLLAGLTGIGSWLFGYPFLTSSVLHLDLPALGEIHIASAMFFDAGVFSVVVGATMLALSQLSQIGRRAEALPVNQAAMDCDPSHPLQKDPSWKP